MAKININKLFIFLIFLLSTKYFYSKYGVLGVGLVAFIFFIIWILYCHYLNVFLGKKIESYISLFI